MMEDIEYKLLTSEDIGRYKSDITCLMEVVLHDNITQDYPDDLAVQYVQKMPEFIQDGSAVIVGGISQDKLVGFSWAYERNIFGERRLHIDMLCVDSSYRRKGIGYNLLQKQIQEAKQREIKIIEAMTTRMNENSYHWFHSAGFEDERVKVRLELGHD